ncbi:hypothetical protein [Methylobacterium durans]|uniref:hypothetical protein n=1 Tax=Methylobacterium durans TaxID=2202825 RepID=UPI0013A58E7B|nr:hypothetical protein [Methylobacterium durans]
MAETVRSSLRQYAADLLIWFFIAATAVSRAADTSSIRDDVALNFVSFDRLNVSQ